MNTTADVIVLGAGIAGAAAAAHLALHAKVLLVEAEDQPGRHATARSAATFFETYGSPAVRALVRASRDFLLTPPEGFAAVPLMTPRLALFIASAAQMPVLHEMREDAAIARVTGLVDVAEACAQVPILRPERLAGAMVDNSGFDIDVDALFQGFLRRAKAAGAQLLPGAGFEMTIEFRSGVWCVHTRHGTLQAPVLVNAAGAWADEVARCAGVQTVGLQPLRRTALIIPAPEGIDTAAWPMVVDAQEEIGRAHV